MDQVIETCPVCFEEPKDKKMNKLPSCEHSFCDECLPNVARMSSLCPVCRKPFCVVMGNQPPNGTMNVIKDSNIGLPGFPNCGSIIIQYHIPSGLQTEAHPKPGKPFYGTSRQAFLPDNGDGNKALRLLRKAFDARLVFTVGRSITTGMDDVVTWNDIHHKTNIHGGPEGYGYPDETYLARLIDDLAAKGIIE